MSYLAANGQEITDEMIDRWCESYERGEFPDGERSTGRVVMGRPPLSSDKTVVFSVKMSAGMKAAIESKAKAQGMKPSEYARSVFTNDLLAVG